MVHTKATQIHVGDLEFKGKSFALILDAHQTPMLKYKNDVYQNMSELLRDFPDLIVPENAFLLAKLCNFMSKGLEFKVIEDIEEYKKKYRACIEYEQTHTVINSHRLVDFGVFDVSIINVPHLTPHQFIFFVCHEYNYLPFRVTYALPPSREYPSVRYELLPYLH
jgi:hypothetical protein